jgi:2-keto-4-pentenoate hydratase/2-oxohepta-3-ene-1,7-dioic acid hydratase in catechol pathway
MATEEQQTISSIISLQPGDIIDTGTPSGVGLGRTPHRWLRPHETIITEIQGIGQFNPLLTGTCNFDNFT